MCCSTLRRCDPGVLELRGHDPDRRRAAKPSLRPLEICRLVDGGPKLGHFGGIIWSIIGVTFRPAKRCQGSWQRPERLGLDTALQAGISSFRIDQIGPPKWRIISPPPATSADYRDIVVGEAALPSTANDSTEVTPLLHASCWEGAASHREALGLPTVKAP